MPQGRLWAGAEAALVGLVVAMEEVIEVDPDVWVGPGGVPVDVDRRCLPAAAPPQPANIANIANTANTEVPEKSATDSEGCITLRCGEPPAIIDRIHGW